MNPLPLRRVLLWLLFILPGQLLSEPSLIPPEAVVVLYNTEDENSKRLALHYAQARSIPEDNLVGLAIPLGDEISREQFNQKIRIPLCQIFDDRKWWVRKITANGQKQPVTLKRRVIVTMRPRLARISPNKPE